METQRLKQFCTIAEVGSLTQAAQLLHITHSGLSKSMRILQAEAGCALFQACGRGLRLTAHGKIFYHKAKQLLQQAEQLFQFAARPEARAIKIGTVEIFLHGLCAELKHFACNDLSYDLLEIDPGEMEDLLLQGRLDYAISYAPMPAKALQIKSIGEYGLGCYYLQDAFPPDMPLAALPFVVPARGLSMNPLGIKERDGWPLALPARLQRYRVNLLSTAIELTLQGLCAIHIPHFVAQRINAWGRPRLVEKRLPQALAQSQTVYLMQHRDANQPDQQQHIIAWLQAAIGAKDAQVDLFS